MSYLFRCHLDRPFQDTRISLASRSFKITVVYQTRNGGWNWSYSSENSPLHALISPAALGPALESLFAATPNNIAFEWEPSSSGQFDASGFANWSNDYPSGMVVTFDIDGSHGESRWVVIAFPNTKDGISDFNAFQASHPWP